MRLLGAINPVSLPREHGRLSLQHLLIPSRRAKIRPPFPPGSPTTSSLMVLGIRLEGRPSHLSSRATSQKRFRSRSQNLSSLAPYLPPKNFPERVCPAATKRGMHSKGLAWLRSPLCRPSLKHGRQGPDLHCPLNNRSLQRNSHPDPHPHHNSQVSLDHFPKMAQ